MKNQMNKNIREFDTRYKFLFLPRNTGLSFGWSTRNWYIQNPDTKYIVPFGFIWTDDANGKCLRFVCWKLNLAFFTMKVHNSIAADEVGILPHPNPAKQGVGFIKYGAGDAGTLDIAEVRQKISGHDYDNELDAWSKNVEKYFQPVDMVGVQDLKQEVEIIPSDDVARFSKISIEDIKQTFKNDLGSVDLRFWKQPGGSDK